MLRDVFLTSRFFSSAGALVLTFVFAFLFPVFYYPAIVLFLIWISLIIVDFLLLVNLKKKISGQRVIPKMLSNGDENKITLYLTNKSNINLHLTLIDELPFQLEIRDFSLRTHIPGQEEKQIYYHIRPTERGAYQFGNLIAFNQTPLGIISKRVVLAKEAIGKVFPSVILMKKFEMTSIRQLNQLKGLKKIRKIGHSYEFEQIKGYVRGDDYRSINWKATGRRASLMINQYQDEQAQQVYNIIDKSRVMRLPFEGLTLMDHAINTSLIISNIALKKHDRAGLMTFSDQLGTFLKAESKKNQLNKILQALYNEKERRLDADYNLLYYASKKLIRGRSLLFLYTNFENEYALDRTLPILRKINKFHLLVVIFFENAEIRNQVDNPTNTIKQIYLNTILRKHLFEKQQMVQKLRSYGIQAFLTGPNDLPIKTVNKYFELKAKGLI